MRIRPASRSCSPAGMCNLIPCSATTACCVPPGRVWSVCSTIVRRKSRVSGVGELSLVVGVAIWKGNQMPVLMYPVEVRKEGRNIENGTVIAFTGAYA